MSGRLQDEYPFERNARAAIMRICTVASISGTKLNVTVPGGSVLNGVTQLAHFTATVGDRVCVLLDRDSATAIGIVK